MFFDIHDAITDLKKKSRDVLVEFIPVALNFFIVVGKKMLTPAEFHQNWRNSGGGIYAGVMFYSTDPS
jgi:hypothetical protein